MIMLFFNFGKVKLEFDFTFFAVVALFTFLDTTGIAMLSFFACIIHEMGHLITMLFCKILPEKITFYGGGIKIISELHMYSHIKQVLVLISGSGVNFIVFLLLFLYGGRLDFYVVMLSTVNLLIGIFNLIPMGYFDGNQLLRIFLSRFLKFKTCSIIEKTISFISGILLLIITLWFSTQDQLNGTMLIVMGYLIISEVFILLKR